MSAQPSTLTLDLSDLSPQSSEPDRLNPEDWVEQVLRQLGCDGINLEKALSKQDFQLPGFGKCRLSMPEIGRGGVQDRAQNIGWANCFDLYRIAKGLSSVGEACKELRKLGPPPLPSITHWRRAVSHQFESEPHSAEQHESSRQRFTITPESSDFNLRIFTINKKGVTLDALTAFGAQQGKWLQFEKSRFPQYVLALPVYCTRKLSVVNWHGTGLHNCKIYCREKTNDGNYRDIVRKVMNFDLDSHRREGFICSLESLDWLRKGEHVPGLIALKCEGPWDALCGWQLARECNRPVLAFTNAFGASGKGERSTETIDPMLSRIRAIGCDEFLVVHDQDIAGRESSLRWQKSAIEMGFSSVRNLELPFEMKDSKGEDLRDWVLIKQRSWADLLGLPNIAVNGGVQ
jgi:hypothetical protein